MRRLIIGLAGVLLTGVAALTGASAMLSLANAPSAFFDGEIFEDIAFSDTTDLELDVYVPEGPSDTPYPVVVFFYGGSWQWGSRTDYPFIGTTLAREGFVTVIPDYRKFPEVRFPGFVEDGADALAWVRENIRDYGGDPEQVHVMGHSAGAHIAALLTFDERYLAQAGSPGMIRSLVGLAGPYDFTPDEQVFVDIFGPAEAFPQMQVPTFVDGDEPPVLLLHGLDDSIVVDRHSRELTQAVRDAGGCAKAIYYPEVDHLAVIGGFTWVFRDSEPMVHDVARYLKQVPDVPC